MMAIDTMLLHSAMGGRQLQKPVARSMHAGQPVTYADIYGDGVTSKEWPA